jgi:hypothetical protein
MVCAPDQGRMPDCGYTTRISTMWLIITVPVCPNEDCEHHGETFEFEWPETE